MRTDSDIKNDILAELQWDPQIRSTEVGVTVKDGAVALHGTVFSYAEKIAAESAAKRVKGVRAIAEEMKVKLPSDRRVTDEDIAKRIANILQWSAAIPNETIKAEVRNGYVTLAGEVDWNFEREAARDQIAGIQGVTAVSNLIKVRTKAAKSDITKEITRALHRNADLEASHIKVDVVNGKVTLDGDVKAWYERKLVEDAVWSAPGVTAVVDNLRIA